MTTPIPCIPTLHAGAGVITDPADIVAYVIRHILSQSGKTSMVYEDYRVSFRTLESEYGANTEELREILQRKIDTVLRRYFPNGDIRVEVLSKASDTGSTYNLEIKISLQNGDESQLILSDAFVTIQDGNVLTIKFSGAKI